MSFNHLARLYAFLPIALITGLGSAYADEVADYPKQPIKIVVPFSPGGAVDVLGRLLGNSMSKKLGQPVIVENRPGAGSNIGANYVAVSKPDGYTLLLGSSSGLAVNPSLFKNMQFDPAKDFKPVVLAAIMPNIVVVPKSSSVNSMQSLRDYLKERGENAFYASAGSGSPTHLGVELYKQAIGSKAIHVPYKGGAPALGDLAAGRADFMFAVAPEALPLIEGGQIRALAVTTQNRLPSMPDLPTVAESGVPGFELKTWYAIVVPAKTPDAIVKRLNTTINESLQEKDVSQRMKELGYQAEGGSPQQLAQLMKSEASKWGALIKKANIHLD